MAISVGKLVYKIRFKTKDLNEILYSDFDILEAINECIRYLNQEKSLKNSDFLEKTESYVQEDMNAEVARYNAEHPDAPMAYYNFPETGVELPEDMIVIVDIIRRKDGYHLSPIPAVEPINPHSQGQYKIVDGRIYMNTDIDLLYRAEIPQIEISSISGSGGFIELPSVFLDLVAKLTVMILTNTADNDVMAKEVSRVADSLITGRRYNNIKVRMPFKV